MSDLVKKALHQLAFYVFALSGYFVYWGIGIYSGSFFRKSSQQDRLQLAIARDEFWNLSKPVFGLSHRFFLLGSGRQLHYLTNQPDPDTGPGRPLVIFIHGWPDSCLIWRHILKSSPVAEKATVVAVDLPGYGGSDSAEMYNPEEVLDPLVEFIVGMREMYMSTGGVGGVNGPGANRNNSTPRVFVVGHDWGCVLAMRLATDAPVLADRFILSNGPLIPLVLDNRDRILELSRKIFNNFVRSPIKHWSCLGKSFDALKPLLHQCLLFGYVAVVQLPTFMVRYLGTGGNYCFLRGAHKSAYGRDRSDFNAAECMAATMGPSANECSTQTVDKDQLSYSPSVAQRAQISGEFFIHPTAYYRDGVGAKRWEKSLETIATLHNIEVEMSGDFRRRRTSSASSGLFEPIYAGSLRAPTTIIWGQKDLACTERICLDGIGDYLYVKGSQVILLPRSGHWVPCEKASRAALDRVIEWYVDGGDTDPKADVVKVVKEVYDGATVMARK